MMAGRIEGCLDPGFTGQKKWASDLKLHAVRDQLSVQERFPRAVVTHDRQAFGNGRVSALPYRAKEQHTTGTDGSSNRLAFTRLPLNLSSSMDARL